MRTIVRWSGWLGLAAVVFGVAATADEVAGDLKAMQGTWTSTLDNGNEARWVFEGDTLTVTLPERKYVAKVSVDSKAKPHPAVDFKVTEGPDDAVGKTRPGIYKLDGKELTICVAAGDADRPKDFQQVEDQAFLFKLTKP